MYPNMRNFTAPYVFVEYPKHVLLADGSAITVYNADEEAAATEKDVDFLVSELEKAPEQMRQALFETAKALGLNPHHRAGVDKLNEMIAAARAEA
jgi:hypothetical protein